MGRWREGWKPSEVGRHVWNIKACLCLKSNQITTTVSAGCVLVEKQQILNGLWAGLWFSSPASLGWCSREPGET